MEHVNVPLHRHALGEEEIEAAAQVMRSGWLTQGPEVEAFEEEFAHYVGAKHAVAVNSCTSALHLALHGVGIGRRDDGDHGRIEQVPDRVLVPTLTFTATAEAVVRAGGCPILVDVDRRDLQLCPISVARELEKRPAGAVVPMHYAGRLSRNVWHSSGLWFIEDAAHALSPLREGVIASCYSFYATKPITTGGDGGMLATNNVELANWARRARLHGLRRGAALREGTDDIHQMTVQEGFKYNMTDVQAAIGRVQLRRHPELLLRRQITAQRYIHAFEGVEEIETPRFHVDHDWHLFVTRLVLDRLSVDLDTFVLMLRERGVGAGVQWRPLHLHEYWGRRLGIREDGLEHDFPVANAEWPRLVSLPIWSGMTEDMVGHVVSTVKAVLAETRR